MDFLKRHRRRRQNEAIRKICREHFLTANDLVAPFFIREGKQERWPISSMPGMDRVSIDVAIEEIKHLKALGISCVALFPVIEEHLKNKTASEALNPDGLNQRAISEIKSAFPDLLVMSDLALDPYSSDGHDGLVCPKTGKILNDETLLILSQMALVQAQAGADILGPSDMMDGRIKKIRDILEREGFIDTLIMSYSAKYASSLYGPFRDALDSTPRSGDKKTYQMDYGNVREAIDEMLTDVQEGADIIMLKPGLMYLDVLALARAHIRIPLAVYNVSGEYAMIKAAAQQGWLDESSCMMEMLTAFKRAGADMILTYFARQAAEELDENAG